MGTNHTHALIKLTFDNQIGDNPSQVIHKGDYISCFNHLDKISGYSSSAVHLLTQGKYKIIDLELQRANKIEKAAPELLEALKNAVKFIKCCPELKYEERKPKGLEKWENIIEKATK